MFAVALQLEMGAMVKLLTKPDTCTVKSYCPKSEAIVLEKQNTLIISKLLPG
jgi:hypothetical protein